MGRLLETHAAQQGAGVLKLRDISEGDVVGKGKRRETGRTGLTNKMAARVRDIQQSRLLPQALEIHNTFLQNNKDGGSFVEVGLPEEKPFYVKFRRLGLPQSERSKLYKTPVQHATIVTAMCLFGVGGTEVTLADGTKASLTDSHAHITQQITDLQINPHLSLYEMEAIYRTSGWINTLRSENNDVYPEVVIASPRINYYFFGLEHAQEGRMSPQILEQWITAVDNRVDRLNTLLTNRIHKDNTKLQITVREPLSQLQPYIKECLRQGKLPEFSQAIQILMKDPIWQKTFEQTGIPTSWIHLGLLSESVEEIRPTLESAGRPTVVVKSQEEESTLVQSERLLKGIAPESALIIGMYPHQEIVIGDNQTETSLFRVESPVALSDARRVYRQFFPIK